MCIRDRADGGGGYAAAVGFSGVGREAAPAGADFEHMVARPQLEFAADAVELVDLGLLQSVVGAVEISAGVGQAAVEEKFVEGVAEIVVIGDIAAAARLRVAAAAMLQRVRESCLLYTSKLIGYGGVQINFHIALRIDHHGLAVGGEHVRGMRQTSQIKLFEIHRSPARCWNRFYPARGRE